jgi:anthranilate phosphoribosyltransferase
MEDDVAALDQIAENALVVHGVDGAVEARVRDEMTDVLEAPGGEVVDDKHFVTASDACVSEVRADEARSPSNQSSHC